MRVLQIAQHASDLDRAVACYEQILGTGPVARFDPPGLAFFAVGEVRLLLDRAAPSALIYLYVHDLDETLERLRADGLTVETEPHTIFRHDDDRLGPAGTDEQMAFVRDTEGNLVGLVTHTHTPIT